VIGGARANERPAAANHIVNCHGSRRGYGGAECTSLGRSRVGSKFEEPDVGGRLVEQEAQLRFGIRCTIADAKIDEVESALGGVLGLRIRGKAHVDEGKACDRAGVKARVGDISQRQRTMRLTLRVYSSKPSRAFMRFLVRVGDPVGFVLVTDSPGGYDEPGWPTQVAVLRGLVGAGG